MLTLNNVTFGYRKNQDIVRNLTMEVPAGTVCGLLGKNGAGKSTLLYLISGLLRPTSGTIDCNGFVPAGRSADFLCDIMIVPEEFSLPNIMLSDYVAINAPFYPNFDIEAMNRYLDIFELTPELHLGKISMGQKKKAFLSFAMACNTSLLLLDEPTNGLDITSKRNFRRAVAECMSDRKTILISTHQVFDVEKILDHVLITDRKGLLLNSSIADLQDKYRFSFTTDRNKADSSLAAVEVPGGINIVEPRRQDDEETEVNLESLFEMVVNKLN